MKILGLTLGQCSGASIFIDNRIVFSASEERFSRKKSDESFPLKSIRTAFDYCNIRPGEIDKVIIAGKNILLIPILLRIFSSFSVADQLKAMKQYWYPTLINKEEKNFIEIFKEKLSLEQFPFNHNLAKDFDIAKLTYPATSENEQKVSTLYSKAISEKLGIGESKITYLDHHSCHAAYALYGSPIRDDNTIVLTGDAWGDDKSGSISLYDKKNFQLNCIKEYNHKTFQLARIYRYTTLYLRMQPNEHEYKVMGLAPYYEGPKIHEVEKVFDSMLSLDGLEFKFNSKIPDIYNYLENNLESFRFDHIASGIQSFTEKILVNWIQNILSEYDSSSLVFSGGLSMNVKANMKISQIDGLEKFFVCGGGGDESLGMGACYKFAESQNIHPEPLENLYLGTNAKYENSDISKISKYSITKYENSQQIVDKLLEGKMIATRFGRMEMGPRSLGNRSIIADPRYASVIQKINRKIKNRDFWMPFAPIVLAEYQNGIIHNPKNLDSPFMTIGFETLNGKTRIPAAVHCFDGTARPQLLKRETNPKLWDVIKQFYDKTGIPALLNTSFNLHGEPLVNSFDDALHVFNHADLDALWLSEHILEK